MPLATYGELKAAIAQYLNRDDLGTQIPLFIELAEQRIFRDLRCPNNEKIVHIEWDYAAPHQIEVPKDYIHAKYLAWNGKPLNYVADREFLTYASATGAPEVFTRIGDRFYLHPVLAYDSTAPTDPVKSPGGTLDIVYYADFSGLGQYTGSAAYSADNDSNSVLTIAGGLYLFGALLEAQPFLMEDQRLAVWQTKFDEIMGTLNSNARRSEMAGSPMVMRR